jgi:hypothetical protein
MYDVIGVAPAIAAGVNADTVTGARVGWGHPVARSPVVITLDGIASSAVTVDLYVEV